MRQNRGVRPLLLAVSIPAVLAAALLGPPSPPAAARSASVLPYPASDVWSSAVRFIRVDRGYEIREKDESAGYILFDLTEGSRKYKGSLELVRTSDEGREATRAIFSLPDLPRHYEVLLLDKLALKVREERGTPPPPPPRKPPEKAPPPDGGTLPRAPGS